MIGEVKWHILTMDEARWRKHLTNDERKRIAKIDAALERSAALRLERQGIANRAAQRARYAERKRPDGGK